MFFFCGKFSRSGSVVAGDRSVSFGIGELRHTRGYSVLSIRGDFCLL